MSDPALRVASEFVRAINDQDLDILAHLMSPGHQFIDSLGNPVTGRDAMRMRWGRYFAMVPDYSIAVEETFTNGNVVMLLGTAKGTYKSKEGMLPENRWHTPIAIRAQIEDGLVAEWRVYADNEPIRALMRKS
jgi:ketosteroid isomerase-like protein